MFGWAAIAQGVQFKLALREKKKKNRIKGTIKRRRQNSAASLTITLPQQSVTEALKNDAV